MKRTTRAAARLGTLAVLAGTVLSAPFAIGTANAAITGPMTITNGAVGSVENQGARDFYGSMGIVSYGAAAADHTTLSLAGTGAYFSILQPAGVTTTSPTTATCTGVATCTFLVGDPAAESVSLFASDQLANSLTGTLNFNGIFLTGCPQTGLDVGPTGGVNYGGAAENTPQNCVTQGQFGQPLTLSGKYMAGGAGVAQNLTIWLDQAGGTAQFSGAQPSTCTTVGAPPVVQLTCTSTTSGDFSYTVQNQGVGNPPAAQTSTTGTAPIITVETRGTTGSYPTIPAAPHAAPPGNTDTTEAASVPGAPTELINWGVGGVTPFRVDATGGQVISPFSASLPAGANRLAEPGDVEQGTFLVMGSCTPAAGNATCDNGTPLAGQTVTVTVDHGFITPNCTIGGVTAYQNCTFNATPAAGTKVGDLKSSGQSATFTTGVNGTFKASFGIAKDSGFDDDGRVVIKVTVAGLPTLLPGDHTTAQSCPTTFNVVPAITGAANVINSSTIFNGCEVDGAWTTNEQPLNGGTAKLTVVPSLSSPNNVAIPTENNFTAADTGTTNVPDVDRVVFKVSLTDQFGNLTSNLGATGANAATLTKTGLGQLWDCGAFTATDACPGGGGIGLQTSNVQQADGSFTEIHTALGGYTNANANSRYQVDTVPNGNGNGNTGYGDANAVPSVNDGNTVVTLSWTPPTTTFATFHAGTAGATNIGTFQRGNDAAVTQVITLNFYNQLSQPVVTFSVAPGNSVGTSTAVTVTATVKDQNGNPIVMGPWANSVVIQVVRSGVNEKSCTPIQDTNANQFIFTNNSGVAGYTFSCNAAGVSNVSMVVTGPGGVQLAQGREAVTFTGANIGGGQVKEKPTFGITHGRHHALILHAATHPSLAHVTVHFYKVVNGLHIIVGSARTGAGGHASLKLTGLRAGHHYTFAAKVVGLSNKYKSVFSAKSSARA